VGSVDRVTLEELLLWELCKELCLSEKCCGNRGQNYTGMKGVVGNLDGIISE
jgi:hypothetical protein